MYKPRKYLLKKISNTIITPFFRNEFNLSTKQAVIYSNTLLPSKTSPHIKKRNPKILFNMNKISKKEVEKIFEILNNYNSRNELNLKLLNDFKVDYYIYKVEWVRYYNPQPKLQNYLAIKIFMKYDTKSERYLNANFKRRT